LVRHIDEQQQQHRKKITDMRTRIERRYDDTLTHHLTGQRTRKLPVEFDPGRNAILPVHIVASREYLRDLRAAEMSAWEKSGGDFLAS
jgi:hypothetical protein